MTQQQTMFDALTCDPMELIERLGDDVDTRRWPERLHTLYEIHRNYNAKRLRMSERAAQHDARDRCILVGDYLGGRGFILPRGDALRRALRDKQMWLDFTGNNYEALAATYGLHLMHVYRIIAQQRALFAAPLPGRLFDS